MKLAVFGAGAIGGSVGAWLAERGVDVCFVARGETLRVLRDRGITLYKGGETANRHHVFVRAVAEMAHDVDVVVLAVKNYSLEEAAATIHATLGDKPVIVALQNGVENQTILPRFFSKVIYGVVGYNAWLDAPGVIGYQKKGPLVLGVLQPDLRPDLQTVVSLLNRGVRTVIAPNFEDAAHSKLILNLTNSFTTLVGHGYRPISSLALFQKILSELLYEGIQIVRAAGYRECRIGGMPGWALITASARLPQILTRPLFRLHVRKMVMSSMAQDVMRRQGDTELEYINGYIVQLADRHGVAAPVNRALYDLCKREFAKPDFQPLDVHEVWMTIQRSP